MVSLASAVRSASDEQDSGDGLHALLQWRLMDPSWKPSFPDLLDDVQTIEPGARPSRVLAMLAAMVRTDPALADRIRALADEARERLASGQTLTTGEPDAEPAPLPIEVRLPGLTGAPPA